MTDTVKDLDIRDEGGHLFEHWESTYGNNPTDPGVDEIIIPEGERKAQLWAEMPAEYFNWLQKTMLDHGLIVLRDAVRNRALWNEVGLDGWFTIIENGQRGTAWAGLNGFNGALLGKEPESPEFFYFAAIGRLADGVVRLAVTSPSQAVGDIVLSVGVAESLDGPWTTYLPDLALHFDPQATQPQKLEIATGVLVVGKTYYYRIGRAVDPGSGDSLGADVLVVSPIRTR